MAMKHELISLEPIESSNDEWVNFVRKNAQPPGRIEIPESVFYKSVKLKIRVNCTSQESEVLSIYSRINLAQYCKSPTKEYLLLSADGLDVFLPIKNGTVFLARQKNDLRFRIGFGDGAKNNDFFRGYVLSQQ